MKEPTMPASATETSSHDLSLPADCETVSLGVAFFDLSRMFEWAGSSDDAKVAGFLQTFYQLAADHLEPAGGRIVKFIGDAGLVVCPEESVEELVFALNELSADIRKRGQKLGIDTYLNVNVHFGPVLAGSYGPKGAERYDVIGKTVNIAARLGRRGITLSTQAFRCLSEEGRKRFNKIKQPITYRLKTRSC
jgi:class 3 adenylate cyclase